MAFDLKKMSFGQLAALGGAAFVVVLIIAGFVISATSKPPQKVVSKRAPVQFEASASDVAMEQLRAEIKQLRERVESNAQSSQAAFAQTAAAIDQQAKNIGTLDSNIQVTANRVTNLEKARIGTRVNVVKPEDQAARPSRAERLAAAERKSSGTKPMTLSNDGDYKALATVGNRAWVRSGDEEYSVTAGEAIPIPTSGQLVVKKVAPNGQVSVAVETAR